MGNGFESFNLFLGWFIGLALTIAGYEALRYNELNSCAKENNVYWCKHIAVPVEQPRVVIKKPDLLPPPDVKVGK